MSDRKLPLGESPYPGPRPFERNESACFFGRDKEISDLVGLALSYRIVLLSAQSGAGKSSLLNAGLGPALDKEGAGMLTARLAGDADAAPGVENVFVHNVLDSLWRGPQRRPEQASMTDGLRQLLAQLGLAAPGPPADRLRLTKTVVLVIDQAEELFTLYPQYWEHRLPFLRQLVAAQEVIPDLDLMLSIRDDYVAELDSFGRVLRDGLRHRYRLERLRRAEALDAVVKPLRGRGIELLPPIVSPDAEPPRPAGTNVAERLVDDLLVGVRSGARAERSDAVPFKGEFVEAVHLQIACSRLWEAMLAGEEAVPGRGARQEARVPDVLFRWQDKEYRADGAAARDIDEALTSVYERALERARAEQGVRTDRVRAFARAHLVTPHGTRGLVSAGEFEKAHIPRAAVAILEDERVLRRETRAGAEWFEITHDRFLGPISRSNERRRRARIRHLTLPLGILAAIALAVVPALLSTRLRDSELTSALEQARKKSDSFQSLGSAADVERSREPRDALALVKEVQGEAERLKAESKLLRTDRDQCRAELRAQAQREQQLRETHPSWPIPTKLAPEPLPLTAVVQPRASAKPLGSKGSYSFELWLDVPEDRAREIQRVTYVMDHPTFRQKELVSEERSTGFKTGYVGWGCLDSVDVTLRLANEKSETLNFDQCSAISHGESPGGVSPR